MKYNILGIDPGNNIGFAVCTVDMDNPLQLYVEATFKKVLSTGDMIDTLIPYPSPEIVRLTNLEYDLRRLIAIYNIEGVACEDAYIHHSRPQAARSIITYVSHIEYVLFTQNGIRLEKIHNRIAKKNLEDGTTTKDDIKSAILNNSNIIFNPNIDIVKLEEHEFDAIGIAYTYKNYLFGVL